AEDGIRDRNVTGVQTCALPILAARMKTIHFHPQLGNPVFISFNNLSGSTVQQPRDIWRHKECRAQQGIAAQQESEHAVEDRRTRSEERRVGKEWRSRWGGQDEI